MVASEPFRLAGLCKEKQELCTVEATVTTGFESVARDECDKKLNTRAVVMRGRIGFDVRVERINEVLNLKCVDNVAVLIGEVENIEFKETKEECLKQIEEILTDLDWSKGLAVWKKFNDCELSVQEIVNYKENVNAEKPFTFRVTTNRVGQRHAFQSPEVSCSFGSAINEYFLWKVDLTKFHLHVLLNICENHVYVALALVKESLHRRNLEYFGPTTLRPTISHCMLRLASIEDGDVVCDPMCGSGSIVVEGIVSWPNAVHVCGDIHQKALPKTKQNVDAVNGKESKKILYPVDIFQWDATCLPFQTNSIDVIVTDLPFGKKMGSKFTNQTLYPKILTEFARVVKVKTGRLVFLTADQRHIHQALKMKLHLWSSSRRLNVNIGGLNGLVFQLHRTDYALR